MGGTWQGGVFAISDCLVFSCIYMPCFFMYLQLKTTYTHTASYVPGQNWGSSSNTTMTTSDPSDVNMETDTLNVPVEAEEGYWPALPVVKPKKAKHNSRGPRKAEKCQMDRLETQHLLQLIGALKWSHGIIVDHETKVKEYMGRELQKGEKSERIIVEYHTNRNNIGAHGLFIFEHRVYPTRLKICEITKALNYPMDLFMAAWGKMPFKLIEQILGRRVPSIQNLCTRFTIAEEYLDIFEPVHLKAFLIYLRVLIWGQNQISKHQAVPTVEIIN